MENSKVEPPKQSMLDRLTQGSIYPYLQILIDGGWYYLEEGEKLKPPQLKVDTGSKWIHVCQDPDRYCRMYFSIFNHCGFIPEKCLHCWKVVVDLPTVRDLINMYSWQMKASELDKNLWCKAGPEERNYVFRNYGAYFYCDNETDAIKRAKQVRQAMTRRDIKGKIIVKRGCTEMEFKHGNFDDYKKTVAQREIEGKIYLSIDYKHKNQPQSEEVRENCLKEWLSFAWGRADSTAKQFNNGEPFYPKYKTYYED